MQLHAGAKCRLKGSLLVSRSTLCSEPLQTPSVCCLAWSCDRPTYATVSDLYVCSMPSVDTFAACDTSEALQAMHIFFHLVAAVQCRQQGFEVPALQPHMQSLLGSLVVYQKTAQRQEHLSHAFGQRSVHAITHLSS